MNGKSYIDWFSMSDNGLTQTIGAFVKHHRLNQNRTQVDVAKAANISRSTLGLLEKGETVTIATLLQVLRVLELLHVMDIFTYDKEVSPIAYAKLQEKSRKRASSSRIGYVEEEDLGW